MSAMALREVSAREILKGLHPLDLRNLAKNRELTTRHMGAAYIHRVRSRCPDALRISPDGRWPAADQATIDNVHRHLSTLRLIQIDLQVCASQPVYHARLYVPLIHADLGCLAGRAMLPAPADWSKRQHAELTAIVLPEWSEQRAVLVDQARSIGFVLGSDYYGDIHNSLLRLLACKARTRGHLALHAGSAELLARHAKTGELARGGLLFFGAGGAGKTTLAAHDFGLDTGAGEKASIRQDDRVILHPSGLVQGTEGQGLYIRTLGLRPDSRPALHAAAVHEDSLLENVWINGDASIDFADDSLTTNGRAVVPIRRIAGADGQIDLPRCTHLFFLVRDEHLPIAARLTPTQAVQTFQAAEANRPADRKADEANLLLAFLEHNPDVQCFLLNTGRADADQTAALIREICREAAEWKRPGQGPFEQILAMPACSTARTA